jgi:hypothetical protein
VPAYLEDTQGTGTLTPGTPQNFHGTSTAFFLFFPSGFTFPFCGYSTSYAYVWANGQLTFPELMTYFNGHMLYPYYGGSTSGTNDDIYVDTNATRVIIRWCSHPTSQPDAEGTLNFQLTLYPNGQFRFTYGEMSTNTAPVGAFAMMKDGSTDWSVNSVYSGSPIVSGSTALFTPARLPPGLSVDAAAGVLGGSPATNDSYQFKAAVTDNADLRLTQRASRKFTLAVEADADLDGLPDDWEIENFQGTNAPLGGRDEDYDGDGMSNWREWMAGTAPTNALSLLRLTGIWDLETALRVRFDAVSDRRYHLQGRAGLVSGGWADWTNWYGDTTGPVLLDFPGNGSNAFFRVKVDP